MKGSDKSKAETEALNQELQQRHYEYVSNCNDGQGDAAACHSQAEWFAVVDKDYKQAAAFYDRNCQEKGYAASCFNLGRLYLAGKDIEQSDHKAAELFQNSCDKGHLEGCDHLGTMYVHGMGVAKDLDKARTYLQQACDYGEARSCYRLASMCLKQDASDASAGRDSESRRNNVLRAKSCLEKACDANFAPACHNLAVMYKKGDVGIEPNLEQFQLYSSKTKDLVQQANGALAAGVRLS